MKRRHPPRQPAVPQRNRHSTVAGKPPARAKLPHPPQRPPVPKLTLSSAAGRAPSGRHVARLFVDDEPTVLDMLDNLLSKGVVLTADVVLALANVDLIYLRLSVILCAAGRVLPRARR